MSRPKVSVIIPSYNRQALIGATIESLERQTLPPHEIIVVDDGSTDGSPAYLRGFGDRIRLVEQANAGPGAARNAGLAIAGGDFIQFFDSDDLATADKIERQVIALEASTADIAYGPWAPTWFEGDRAVQDPMVVQQGPVDRNPVSAFLRGWVCLIPCCVIRRDLLVRLGGYPTASRTGEDLELFFRALAAGATLIHAPQAMVLVRQHPDGQISQSPEGETARIGDLARLARVVETELADHPALAGGVDKLAWQARTWEALQRERLAGRPRDSRSLAAGMLRVTTRIGQVRAGLRRRMTGSRLPRSYAPGVMTASQADQIRALGYTPARR